MCTIEVDAPDGLEAVWAVLALQLELLTNEQVYALFRLLDKYTYARNTAA